MNGYASLRRFGIASAAGRQAQPEDTGGRIEADVTAMTSSGVIRKRTRRYAGDRQITITWAACLQRVRLPY
jgi:hypothetical protein